MNRTKLPVHVSLIMDGNGRWAQKQGKERVYGHLEGVESVRDVMATSVELGIKYVSFFAFSEENWNRPNAEVAALMELMGKAMCSELHTFEKYNVRFMVLGNREHLSGELKSTIDRVSAATAGNTGLTMILFLSYSGRWDIVQAARKMAHDLKNNPNCGTEVADFSRYLVTDGIPDPDLLIRTSGEKRMSNYLLWQCAYTEFVFTDVLWPDFRREQYLEALDEYAVRDRRFGKVK
ncbi:MAG TPA: di-trans,poly-cis-decaprenylcistransferase [Rikenellaceae bacterium]|nr:di-trans,poly-cis-decaprenylcistransferase [Rikenellaceae bacterium]HBH20578.1 di-trans,poly-cis-decaprenylcistransferase [Rikenellaceae bacterium]